MNPVNKILHDTSKDRTTDNSLPKWWSRHQQKIEDDILTHETERGNPPWQLIKEKVRRRQAEEEQREESIDKINAMFRG